MYHNLDNIRDSIDRARELTADIRSGRRPSDGDHAAPVIARLCEYIDDLTSIMSDNYAFVPAPDEEQARLRDLLLAEVPASEIDAAEAIATGLAQIPDSTCITVTEWLRAVRRAGAEGDPR